MLFAVMALDSPDITAEKRKAFTRSISRMCAAPRITASPSSPAGRWSMTRIRVDRQHDALGSCDRATIERFKRADPFHKNDVWARVEIHRFDRKE